jgi:hypothetical protein
VFILKKVKVVCFVAVLQVLILNGFGGDGKRSGSGDRTTAVRREKSPSRLRVNGRERDATVSARAEKPNRE